MKKQLLTTALVSSILGFGITSAVAQTTVTGNLDLSYSATTHEGNATATQKGLNTRGFGKESQINIANKGKLNNGMDYVAGFSFEVDGIDTGSAGMWNENTYLDLISGNTTITIGADHIQNPDRNVTNLVGFGYLGIDGINNVISSYSKHINTNYGAYGIGVVQTIPGFGKVSANYTPDQTGGAASNDVLNGLQSTQIDANESMWEVGFKGDFGVKGLDIGAFYNRADRIPSATNTDPRGMRIDGSYNFGNITIAADYARVDGIATGTGTTAAYSAGGNEHKSKSVGLGYAINKDLSVGYAYGKTSSNNSSNPADEKNNVFAIGYNLGPVTAQVQYKKVENHANTTDLDGEQFSAKLSTKF